MYNSPNFLRLYRKRSLLTLDEIAFLMGLSDKSNISRYEKGKRVPSIELLITYHFLFNTSIQSFFEPQSKVILSNLSTRIDRLIEKLKKETKTEQNTFRINFLKQVINRITK